MLRVAVLGAGRIGKVHAATVAAHHGSMLTAIYDVNADAAQQLATMHGCRAITKLDEIWRDSSIDAVVIASRTDTHCDLIEAAVNAGKPILCEKPIDLRMERVQTCFERIRDKPHHIQIGFCRRYDANFIALRDAVHSGRVGNVESIHIVTRVVTPPTYAYVLESGGLFRDMTIHDIDIGRFLLGVEPVRVFATGRALIDPEVGRLGDIDSAKLIIEFPSGAMLSIENSRRSVYGLDHRVEVFGSEGLLSVRNGGAPDISFSDKTGTDKRPLLNGSPIYGYQDAFDRQWAAFAKSVETKTRPEITFEDGWRTLAITMGANQSLASGNGVDLSEFMSAIPSSEAKA